MKKVQKDEVIEIRQGDENSRHIVFKPTLYCNYDCIYCPGHKKEQKNPTPIEEVERIAKLARAKIDSINEKYPTPYERLSILGGEVSSYDLSHLFSLLVTKRTIKASLVTNASGSIENYQKLGDFLKEKKIKYIITASYHPPFTTLDNFVSKCIKLNKICDSLFCQITVTRDNVEECQKVIEKLKENNLIYKVCLARAKKGEEDKLLYYSKEAQDFVKENQESSPKGTQLVYKSGKIENVTRYSYMAQNKDGAGHFLGWLCYNRTLEVVVSKGRITLRCPSPTRENIENERQQMICYNNNCPLCGVVFVKKEM